MSLVLDSSVALAWIYSAETTPEVLHVLERVTEAGAVVPSLWPLEVANVLEQGVRKKRHTAGFRNAALTDLALLPIRVDPETAQHAWQATLHLAERHRLTVYDAAYLELALRRNVPLATLDQELRTAARAEKVPLLGK